MKVDQFVLEHYYHFLMSRLERSLKICGHSRAFCLDTERQMMWPSSGFCIGHKINADEFEDLFMVFMDDSRFATPGVPAESYTMWLYMDRRMFDEYSYRFINIVSRKIAYRMHDTITIGTTLHVPI